MKPWNNQPSFPASFILIIKTKEAGWFTAHLMITKLFEMICRLKIKTPVWKIMRRSVRALDAFPLSP